MPEYFVILTRSAEQNREICAGLGKGVSSLDLPLFRLVDTEHADQARRQLGTAGEGDAVVFVSPAAVKFSKKLFDNFPPSVRLTAPGIATLKEVKKAWPKACFIDNDSTTANSGSEVLAELLLSASLKRVFVARAQSGREYLAQKLTSAGVEVIPVELYQRLGAEFTAEQKSRLLEAQSNAQSLLYITSSEAVDVLVREAAKMDGLLAWMRSGRVLTIHPRIAEKLVSEGFSHVEIIDAAARSVSDRIKELCDCNNGLTEIF